MSKDYTFLKGSSNINRLLFFLKDFSLYGIATSFTKFISIFTVPILTRVFSKAEFGIIDGVSIVSAVFAPLIVFGQDSAIARFYYETDNKQEKKTIITQGGIIELFTAVLVVSFIVIFAESISRNYFHNVSYANIIRLAAFGMLFNVTVRYPQNILKWTFARKKFIILSVGMPSAVILITFILVVILDFGVEGVFYSQIIAGVLFSIIGIIFIISHLTKYYSGKYYMSMLKFGWPYTLPPIFMALIPSLDRYFIIQYVDLTSLGVYAFAHKISRLLSFPIQGFQTAWGPYYLALYKEENVSENYNQLLYIYTTFLVLAVLGVLIFSKYIILFFGSEKYLDSTRYILPLMLSLVFTSLSWITGIGIGLSKKTIYSAISYFISLFAAFISLYFLVPHFGTSGAAYSILFSSVVLFLMNSIFGQLLYPSIRIQYIRPLIGILISYFFMITLFE